MKILIYVYLFILNIFLLYITIFTCQFLQIGEIIRSNVVHHHNRKMTPVLGGIIFIIPVLFMGNNPEKYFIIFHYIIGLLDDFVKLYRKDGNAIDSKTLYVFTVLLGSWFLTCPYGSLNPLALGNDLSNVLHSFCFTNLLPLMQKCFYLFVIYPGIVHSCNLLDGFNGGLSVHSLFVIMFYIANHPIGFNQGFIPAMLVGLISYSLYNLPGYIFMTSTGSYTIGALFVYLLKTQYPLQIACYMIIPCLTAISVILNLSCNYLFNFRLISFSPLHHTFLLNGYKDWQLNIFYNVFYVLFMYFAVYWIKL